MAGPYAQQVLFAPISNVSTGPDAELGTKRQFGGCQYRYIYNDGTNSILPGHGVTVSGAASAYSVVVSSTSLQDVCLGVVRHAAIPAGSYGWVQTEGFMEVEMGLAVSCGTSEPLALGVSGVFVFYSMATSTPEKAVICGRSCQSMASGASGTAYVKCW